MRRIVVILVVFSLLMAAGTLGLNAQPDDLEPIFISTEPSAYKWSADGQSFVFADIHGSARVNSEGEFWFWYQYDVGTEQLTETTFWPLQPMLTNRERGILRPFPDSFIFDSPSKNYLAYASELNPENFNNLTVAKLSTITPASFDDKYIIGPTFSVSEFDVHWSADNSAFVVSQPVPYGDAAYSIVYYVSGFIKDMTKAKSVYVPYVFGNRSFALDVFDISNDGRKVLMYGWETGFTPYQYRFVIWDTSEPEALLILDHLAVENVLHGSFVPGSNGGQLLFVDVDGIVMYDIGANQKTILYPEINATLYQKAWFSPDSSHLAFVRHTNRSEVFVVDLADYITLPNVTPYD